MTAERFKLLPEQVASIRSQYPARTMRDLGQEFGVSAQTILKVVTPGQVICQECGQPLRSWNQRHSLVDCRDWVERQTGKRGYTP